MILRPFICLVTVIALVLVGFGHRTLAPDAQAQADAYILAGGSFADLCGDGRDPRSGSISNCMACVISGACDIPTNQTSAVRLTSPDRASWPVVVTVVQSHQERGSHPPRAPPLV